MPKITVADLAKRLDEQQKKIEGLEAAQEQLSNEIQSIRSDMQDNAAGEP